MTASDGINNIVLRDVGAVEVYRSGAETPPAFAAAGRNCGVVLVWTQVGPRHSGRR